MSEQPKRPPKSTELLWAAMDLELPSTQKLVLMTLVRHADWDTGICHPSRKRLAKKSGFASQTVSSTINDKLVPSGLVAIVNPGGGRYRNRYRVNLDELLARAKRDNAEWESKRWKPSHTYDDEPRWAVSNDDRGLSATMTGDCQRGGQGAVSDDDAALSARRTRTGKENRSTEQVNENRETEQARASSSSLQQQQRAPRVLRFRVPDDADDDADAVECDSSGLEQDATELRAWLSARTGGGAAEGGAA